MLRQPSTPWITFSRASRASNLAVGDLLPRRASIIDASALSAAPHAPPATTSAAPAEPSGLSVSSDVDAQEQPSTITTAPVVRDSIDVSAKPTKRGGWSPLNIAVVAAGLTLSAGLVMATSMYQAPAERAAAHRAAAVAAAAQAATPAADARREDVAPPDLGAALANSSLKAPTPPAESTTTTTTKRGDGKDGKFGRLTIRGAAKSKNVYLDGKRLLGTGSRSFTVLCGAHTVSTAGRNDGKDVEIPCNGELFVER